MGFKNDSEKLGFMDWLEQNYGEFVGKAYAEWMADLKSFKKRR